MVGFTEEGGPLAALYFLGHSVFDEGPLVDAGDGCLFGLVCVGDEVDGGGGVDKFLGRVKIEVVVAFCFGFGRFKDPIYHSANIIDDYLMG